MLFGCKPLLFSPYCRYYKVFVGSSVLRLTNTLITTIATCEVFDVMFIFSPLYHRFDHMYLLRVRSEVCPEM